MKRAWTSYNRSMDEEAADLLHHAVALDPDFAMAYFELAELLPDYGPGMKQLPVRPCLPNARVCPSSRDCSSVAGNS